MGKNTDALKKAAEERLSRIDKDLTARARAKSNMNALAKKTVASKIDPRIHRLLWFAFSCDRAIPEAAHQYPDAQER